MFDLTRLWSTPFWIPDAYFTSNEDPYDDFGRILHLDKLGRVAGPLEQSLNKLRFIDRALLGSQFFSENDYSHYRSITAAAEESEVKPSWQYLFLIENPRLPRLCRSFTKLIVYLSGKLISTVESVPSSGSMSQLDSFKCRLLGSVLTQYIMHLKNILIPTVTNSTEHNLILDMAEKMLGESFHDTLKKRLRSKRDHQGIRFGFLLESLCFIFVNLGTESNLDTGMRHGIFSQSPFLRDIKVDNARVLKGDRLSKMGKRLSKMKKRRLSEMMKLEYLGDFFSFALLVNHSMHQYIGRLSFVPLRVDSFYPNHISNSTLGTCAQAERTDREDCATKWNIVSVLDNPAHQYFQGKQHHGSGSELRSGFKGGIKRCDLVMKKEGSDLGTKPEEAANSPATVLAVQADETRGQFSESEPDCKHEGSGSANEAENECEGSSEGDSACLDTGSQHVGQKRPWAAMDGECSELLTTLAPFIKKQVEEALLPLVCVLRSREEGEQKHRETLLALEKERLALEKERLALKREKSLALEKERLALEHEIRLLKRQRVSELVSKHV